MPWRKSRRRFRQIINDAIISKEVVDVFDAAGIKKPDISILSEEFLAEVRNMARRNLALELLKRLLNDEIKSRARTNMTLHSLGEHLGEFSPLHTRAG